MRGPNLAAMAWRNLWRNRRRTLITMASMAFGLMLAVLFTGLGDSSYSAMIDLAARLGGGHVTLQHPDYQDTPSLKHSVPNTGSLVTAARDDGAHVLRAVARVRGQVLLATARQSKGAFFIAYDPTVEDESTLSVMEGLVEGRLFKAVDERGIVLGERLARNLDVKLGRKVVYTLTNKQGKFVSGLSRVTGIVRTGAPSVDGGLCLLPIGRVRETLGYAADEATQVAVFLDDHRRAAAVTARLQARVGPGADALLWQQAQPELAGFINMKESSTAFMEAFIMLLIAAGIFNTLFVSVMERLREFGILMAIGFRPGQLFRLVMWESAWLALSGVVAGAVVTALPYYLGATKGLDMSGMVGKDGAEVAGVAVSPIMYVSIYVEHAVVIVVAIVTATLLAGLMPAWRAARVEPVEAIKLV